MLDDNNLFILFKITTVKSPLSFINFTIIIISCCDNILRLPFLIIYSAKIIYSLRPIYYLCGPIELKYLTAAHALPAVNNPISIVSYSL